MRALLVGEDNPLSRDPRAALFPRPRGRTGDRLRRILGVTDSEYLRLFGRVNLCSRRWSAREARNTARAISLSAGPERTVVLLGAKVARAFGFDPEPFRLAGPFGNFVVLPHPSGRCRVWNDPRAAERARDLLTRFLLDRPRETA